MKDSRELVSGLLYQRLSDAEQAVLADWIVASPDNAREFVVETFLDWAMRDWFSGQAALRSLTPSQATLSSRWLTPARRWRKAICLAAAAAIAFAVMLLFRSSFENTDSPTLLASLGDCWSTASRQPERGVFERGTYELTKGQVLIGFEHGGQLLVEGPATFAIREPKLVALERGKAVSICRTKRSYGFTVCVPGGAVRDLGTEFGVVVSEMGTSETHVFEGEVELVPDRRFATSRAIVRAGQARKLSGLTGMQESVAWRPAGFVRLVDFQIARERAANALSANWEALYHELRTDPDLLLWCDMNPVTDAKELVNLASFARKSVEVSGGSEQLTFEPGRIPTNNSLSARRAAPLPQVEISGAFRCLTLAAWIKLDPAQPANKHRGLLMSGWDTPGHVHWQFKSDGFRFTFPINDRGQHVIYDAPAPAAFDGNWHFVATAFDGQSAHIVRHFFDGAVVAERAVEGGRQLLQLGWCTVGGWSKHADDPRPLNGQIDDLFVWSRALDAEEVMRLYRQGK